MKNLIVCPKCLTDGKKSVLGEITPEGYFAVMRFHQGYTNIIGKDFAVVCGGCNEIIYIKKEYIFMSDSVVNYSSHGTLSEDGNFKIGTEQSTLVWRTGGSRGTASVGS